VLLPLADALDLVCVSGDGCVLVFFETVNLAVAQGPHVVRLPAMLLLLLRFLTLLAFSDRCCCAPPDIGSNLNQIARVCNTTGDAYRAQNIEGLLDELRRLIARLDAIGHGSDELGQG
jgi:hypothetical protein